MKNQMYPLAVRVDEAARLLGVGRTTLYHLVKDSRLHCTKIDRCLLFRVSDLEDFLKPPLKPPKWYSDAEVFSQFIETLKRLNHGQSFKK